MIKLYLTKNVNIILDVVNDHADKIFQKQDT